MDYKDGTKVKVRDRVELANGSRGFVVWQQDECVCVKTDNGEKFVFYDPDCFRPITRSLI